MEQNDDDWSVDCSDDEKYEAVSKIFYRGHGSQNVDQLLTVLKSKDPSTIPAYDESNNVECRAVLDCITSLISGLEANNRILELEWKCPGRRGPSPLPTSNRQQDHLLQDYKTEEKSDFDFMDEMASPRIPVRRIGESTPKGSAKKKTASFNGVLSTMLRHRRLEQQEINSSPKKSEADSPNSKPQAT